MDSPALWSRRLRLAIAIALIPLVSTCGGSGGGGTTPTTPVATVSVSPGADTLFVGTSLNLNAQPKDAAGNPLSGRTVAWTSSAPAVASVSATGVVSGLTHGVATISATSEGHAGQAALSVRIGGAVAAGGGTISAASGAVSLTLPAGAVAQSTDIFIDTAASPRADPRLVSGTAFDLGPTGTSFAAAVSLKLKYSVAAVPNGNQSALVIALDSAGAWRPLSGVVVDSVAKTVTAPITHFSTYAILGQSVAASIAVTPNPASVQVGGSGSLAAAVKDAQGNVLTGLPVTWASTNTGIVTVSQAGVVTGVSAGTTTVTATRGAISGSTTVTVNAVPVGSVVVSPSPASVVVAGTLPLVATVKDAQGNVLPGRVVTWISSDATVATVASDGTVTGIAVGTVTVTATSGGVAGSTAVTVSAAPVASLAVAPRTATIPVGATEQLTAILRDSAGHLLTGRAITWISQQPGIATVDTSGLVTGLATGTCTITATSGGKSDAAVVGVQPGSAEITRILDSARVAGNVPALAGAIVTTSGIWAADAVGLRKVGDPTRVTRDDLFHLGSDLKAMTAGLIGRLVDSGQLQWTTTLGSLFPQLAGVMRPEYAALTIEDLLAQRSGIMNNPSRGFTGPSAEAERDSLVRWVVQQPLASPTGTFYYSNVNYIIAGAVAERLWQTPFEQLISDSLFLQLGMASVGWGPAGTVGLVDQPWGHYFDANQNLVAAQTDNPRWLAPAGRAHMSIQDWATWVQVVLRAEAGGPSPWSASTAQELTASHVVVSGTDGYALGWNVTQRSWAGPTQRVLFHAGSNGLNWAEAWLAPDAGFAVIVVTNQGDATAAQVVDATAGRLISLSLTGH